MAKVGKMQCKSRSRGHKETPYLLSCARKNMKNVKSFSKVVEKKDWEDATCSVCMEVPHNAILLLCSSYNKGCRPYMCATSRRFSNCFEQYKKAYTKATSVKSLLQETDFPNFDSRAAERNDNTEVPELLCPLCRTQVKGCTVFEAARTHLNAKKRSCMQDDCSFVGNYRKLRKHVRSKHPSSRPREVDPVQEEKWKILERERERNDVISTILSSTPGARVMGDYVVEPNNRAFYRDETDSYEEILDADLIPMSSFGFRSIAHTGSNAFSRVRLHRLLFDRSRRRRMHR